MSRRNMNIKFLAPVTPGPGIEGRKSNYTPCGKFPERRTLPMAFTVGELIELLTQCPPELPICVGTSAGVRADWINLGVSSRMRVYDRETLALINTFLDAPLPIEPEQPAEASTQPAEASPQTAEASPQTARPPATRSGHAHSWLAQVWPDGSEALTTTRASGSGEIAEWNEMTAATFERLGDRISAQLNRNYPGHYVGLHNVSEPLSQSLPEVQVTIASQPVTVNASAPVSREDPDPSDQEPF